MRVEKLSIENFRGIGNLELEFVDNRPVVFIGTNGSGKSSVLDALYLLLDDLDVQMRNSLNVPHAHISSEEVRIGCRSANIRATFKGLKSGDVSWSVGGPLGAAHVPDKIDTTSRSQEYLDIHPTVAYFPTVRRVRAVPLVTDRYPQNPLKGLEEPLNSGLGFPVQEEIDFERFFLWFRYREDLENETRRDNSNYRDIQIEAVRSAITHVLPQVGDLRVRRNAERLTLLKDEIELNITQLSDGEKGLIALVGDIARRLANTNFDIEHPLNGAGIVLIDEIELHLHPKWQRDIIPHLVGAFPNCQFFLTTHSPQVLSEMENANVFLLQPANPNEGVTATRIDKLYGRDTNRILEDVMGTAERPSEVKADLRELFRIIDAGDLKAARKKREDLGKTLYSEEPDFAAADVLMHRLEMRGK